MKLLNLSAVVFIMLLSTACSKSNTSNPQGTSTTPVTHADSLTLITSQKWVFYQDSTSNVNFDFSDGEYPVPGVLNGYATDYWEFKSNGSFSGIVDGITLPETTYQFLANSKLYIISSPDAGPSTITTLNSNTLIFVTADTSSTGGTYYQRIWLKK